MARVQATIADELAAGEAAIPLISLFPPHYPSTQPPIRCQPSHNMDGGSKKRRSLNDLPDLVLDLISDYLTCASGAPRNRYLSAFSLASRRCSEVAARHRYKVVQVIVREETSPKVAVDRLNARLGPFQRWRYVRVLTVQHMDYKDHGEEGSFGDDEHDPLSVDAWSKRLGPRAYQDFDASVGTDEFTTMAEDDAHEGAWESLAELVSRLHGLKDLVWSLLDPFPMCVLAQVHESNRARLHVETFCLRSLIQPHWLQWKSLYPAEKALATSPRLHSIVVPFSPRYNNQQYNHNKEAVLQMVAGAAPNLREVTFYGTATGGDPSMAPVNIFKRKKYGSEDVPQQRGELTKLTFSGAYRLSPEELELWQRHTQLSSLTHLQPPRRMDRATRLRFLQMLEAGEFSGMHHLSLSRKCAGPNTEEAPLFSDILRATVPLRSLTISEGVTYQDISSILDHHGPHLRRLRHHAHKRHPKAMLKSAYEVLQLAAKCPNIEELQVSVMRTLGDSNEVATYCAFSQFRKLRQLILELNCQEASYFASGGALWWDMQHALKQAAMDSKLAESIFKLTAGDIGVLERVAVVPSVQLFALFDERIVRLISRRWECLRGPTRGESLEVIVRDLNVLGANARQYFYDEDLRNRKSDWAIAWREIWPPGDRNWKEQWRSVPLATSEDDIRM